MSALNHKRDDQLLAGLLTKVDGQVLVKAPLYILVPERYYAKGLAIRGEQEMVFGMFAICTETHYTFHSLCAMIETQPVRIVERNIEGVAYSALYYEPGDALIAKTDIVQNQSVIFSQFDEFLFNGKPPIGMNYQDICRCFDTMIKYSGLTSIDAIAVLEVMAMIIAKAPGDWSTAYKEYSGQDLPDFRSMGDVENVVQGTLNRMAGAGFNEGLVKSLLDDNPESRQLERIILK